MFEIEKNVPVPAQDNKGKRTYPFNTMEVGDSFVVPAGYSNRIQNALSGIRRKKDGKKFTTRTLPDRSLRVWRIAGLIIAVAVVAALGGPAHAMCFTYQCSLEDAHALGVESDCESAGLDWSYCMSRYDQDRKTNERLDELENQD